MHHVFTSRALRLLGAALALITLTLVAGLPAHPVPALATVPGTNQTFDRQFIDMKVPHHMGAVAMARIALARAQHPAIKRLARSIIADQDREIARMKAWRKAWYGRATTPPMDRMPMLPGLMMHMDMMGDVSRLKTATPFDRAFIDAMIPHHRMAVAAAKLELTSGSHPELKALALSIIESQSREIGLMQAYREVWYGSIDHMPGMDH